MTMVPAIREADRPSILDWLYRSSAPDVYLVGKVKMDYGIVPGDSPLPEMPAIRVYRKTIPVWQSPDGEFADVIYAAVRWDTNEEICRTHPTPWVRP